MAALHGIILYWPYSTPYVHSATYIALVTQRTAARAFCKLPYTTPHEHTAAGHGPRIRSWHSIAFYSIKVVHLQRRLTAHAHTAWCNDYGQCNARCQQHVTMAAACDIDKTFGIVKNYGGYKSRWAVPHCTSFHIYSPLEHLFYSSVKKYTLERVLFRMFLCACMRLSFSWRLILDFQKTTALPFWKFWV